MRDTTPYILVQKIRLLSEMQTPIDDFRDY